MAKVRCPECEGEAECSHAYDKTDEFRQSGQLFDIFSIECRNCGYKDHTTNFAGHYSSDGQPSNTQRNTCPYCLG